MEEYEQRIHRAISISELLEIEKEVESNEDLASGYVEHLLDLIDEKKGDFE